MNKALTTKDQGIVWQVHTYLQWYHLFKGLSLSAAYHLIKHDYSVNLPEDSRITYLQLNENTHSLHAQYVHNLIVKGTYDFCIKQDTAKVIPQVSVFYKHPLGGKNAIAAASFGGQLGIRF